MDPVRVAARYLAKQFERPRYDTGRLTRVLTEDFPLEVPEMRFQQAMVKFAKAIGGDYRDGKIKLPHAPGELTVLYQKWYAEDGPSVAFTVFPTKQGNKSKLYRMFKGPVKGSNRLFQQFIAWLGIVGSAVQQNAYGTSGLARKFKPSQARVAAAWRAKHGLAR